MVSGFWVWSKAQGINSTDFSAGVPNLTEEPRPDARSTTACSTTTGRTTSPSTRSTRCRASPSSKALGLLVNEWQLSGVYRWTSGRPDHDQLLDSRHRRREPDRHRRQSERAHRRSPAIRAMGYSGDPYRQFATRRASRRRSRAAMATNRRASSRATPPINNLDLSISKNFTIYSTRASSSSGVDMFNVLNHDAVHARLTRRRTSRA